MTPNGRWGHRLLRSCMDSLRVISWRATRPADPCRDQRFGRERYEKEIAGSRKIYEDLAREGKDRPLSFHGWTTPQQAGGRLPYHKGALFLHLLRERLGEDAFWRGLRR